MNELIFIFLFLIAAFIFYQDLQRRSVLWWLFPLLAAIGLMNALSLQQSWLEIFTHIGINSIFLVTQFGLLYVFYAIRSKGKERFIDHKIGWGDLLFLLSCCFFFSPANFLLFYCLSLLFSLAAHLLARSILPAGKYAPPIPLAGWQAVFLICFTGIYQLLDLPITDDHWLSMQLQTL